jgi:hypothetical protein
LAVVDISNANNDIVVGQIISLKKPVIFIANTRNQINPFYSKYVVLIYNNNDIETFLENFVVMLNSTIRQIEEDDKNTFKLTVREKKKRVFISYCHKDKKYMERIIVHIKPLERNGILDIWVDTMIKTGELWKAEVEKSLSSAEVGILLISADYLASEFIIANELPPLLENAQKNGTKIIPIVAKPCRFLRDKNLNIFQAINNPEKPLCSLNEKEREEIYEKLSKEVEELIQSDA